ncbi:uncharacterized protein [Miscanthus floridulus]|uniref:uncharacterized protein n=1 Tax=Miscanthus floridulus TaxID=154761 RepID=UPI00345AC45D
MGDRSVGNGGGGGDRITYPSLTATNYTSWSIRAQAIMEDQGVWEVMEPPEGTSEQGAVTAAAAKTKDKKKTGKEVWDSLKARFVGEERVKEERLHTLKSEFDGLRMKEDDMIDGYAGMSVRYANLGGTLDDAALVKKLFDTVRERYINVVTRIEQFYDLKKLAFDEAVGRLKAYEERTKQGATGARPDTEEPVLLERTSHQVQVGGTLNFDMEQLKLFFTGDEGSTREIWYVDNGASNHMTGDRLKFRYFDQTFTAEQMIDRPYGGDTDGVEQHKPAGDDDE